MQQKNSAGNFFSEIQATLKEIIGAVPTAAPFDFKTILEAQRKNFQALTEANQRAMQGWQTLAQRQTEMVSQFVQDNSGLARETMADTPPKDKIAKQAEILRASYEKSIVNTKELGEIVRKVTMDTADVLNRRIVSSLSEIKSTAKDAAAKEETE